MLKFDSKRFIIEMENLVNYSVGFLEGAKSGKNAFLNNLGAKTTELLKEYIDASARVNPAMLHHVYEWSQTGSPDARLFDINYTVSGLGLSLKSTFRQSISVQSGSNVPFYNKAEIMENGIPVKIKPKNAKVLVFDVDGESVFTQKPVTVRDPGGLEVKGAYQQAFDSFFRNYFSQAFLKSSGLADYLSDPVLYKRDLPKGIRGGKAVGVATGYRWIANAGVEI